MSTDNKTAPEDDGFKPRKSRAARKREFNKSRGGARVKKKKEQARAKDRRQKQQREDASIGPVSGVRIETTRPDSFATQAYEYFSTRCDYQLFEEAIAALGWQGFAFDPSDKSQRHTILDAIFQIQTQRILGNDEDTKHTESKDTPGSTSLMDTSADVSVLSQSPIVEMTDSSDMLPSTDPTPASELVSLVDATASSELKMDLSESLAEPPSTAQSQPTMTSVAPFVETTPQDARPTTAPAVPSSDPIATAVVVPTDDGNRRKPKRKRRRKKKTSELSPPVEQPIETVPDTNRPTQLEPEPEPEPSPMEEDEDDLPVMNGGHNDEEDYEDEEDGDYEVVEPQLSEEDILAQQVDSFDCSRPESRRLIQSWVTKLQNDFGNKLFAQMFHSAKGVEQVMRSVLRNPQKCVCDNEVVILLNETLLGPRDYHVYLFQETKRLATKLVERESIREGVLDQIEQIIVAQKQQPQSSVPEFDKQVFEMPSKHWSQSPSCPSLEMWQNVDNQALNLQEKHNLLREGKMTTLVMQPNKNPLLLHSLKTMDKLVNDGTARLAQRELSARTTLNKLEQDRAQISNARETKLKPLEQKLVEIQTEYQRLQNERRRLEQKLTQINNLMANYERDEQELERQIRQENDFGNKEKRLQDKIDDKKFEVAKIQSESACFTDLRSIALEIYRRLDDWSNQQISDQLELQDGLAHSYLKKLITFIEQYAQILQFFRNRVTFAQELIEKRKNEQKDATALYGRDKKGEYDDEIAKYQQRAEEDNRTSNRIKINMYKYIEGAKEVVRETRFQEFIYHLQKRVGSSLDLSKYIRPVERPRTSGGIDKGRRETGAQTASSRDFPSRGPRPSNTVSMTTHDLSISSSISRNTAPVMRRGYPQPQPANSVPVMGTSSGVSSTRQPTVADHSAPTRRAPLLSQPKHPPMMPQFSGFSMGGVGPMLPFHQQNLMQQSAVSSNLASAPPRVPTIQGSMDMEQRQPRRGLPIVGAARRR